MKYSSLQKLLSILFPIVLGFPFYDIPRGLGQSITERSINNYNDREENRSKVGLAF